MSTRLSLFHRNSPRTKLCGIVLSSVLTVAALAAPDETGAAEPGEPSWSRFLNGGQCTAGADLPTQWSPESNAIAWRATLEGYGQSSPVVARSRVFVTSTSGANKEQLHVTAFDLPTGEKLWQTDFVNPSPEENNGYVSRAAPTPAVDDSGLFVFSEGGVLAFLAMDGTIGWQRDLVAEFGTIKARHGLASSLEQNARHIFVWVERSEDPYLMAVDKATGQTRWKVAGLGSTTWSSPRLIQVGQAQHLVCSSSGKLVGFDPLTGNRLWELDALSGNTSCTPMPVGDGRFILGASDSRDVKSPGNGASSNGLVQIAKNADDSFSASFVWQAERATCSFGSPLVVDDRVWIVNKAGVLYQLDLKTGEELAAARVKSGSVWATPLRAGNNVYLFGQKGTTSVLSVADGREVATNQLWDALGEAAGTGAAAAHVQYAAAAAGDYLLIRRGDTLTALKKS